MTQSDHRGSEGETEAGELLAAQSKFKEVFSVPQGLSLSLLSTSAFSCGQRWHSWCRRYRWHL